MAKKIMVLLSGGMDSATCLAMAKDENPDYNVIGLCLYYGQKHHKEIECARKVAKYYEIELLEMDLSKVMQFSNCPLLIQSDKEIKHVSYEEQRKEIGDKEFIDTYVPFRNGLFLSVATSVALQKNVDEIWYGAHSDDVAAFAYPDCSDSFVNYMRKTITEGTNGKVYLRAPLIFFTKQEIALCGLELGVPYHLTWSCYEGGDKPCGICATCKDRIEAFRLNGVVDPLMEDSYE